MPLNVLLAVDLHDAPVRKRTLFEEQMTQQGWRKIGEVTTAYQAAINVSDESRVVVKAKAMTRDAANKADITDYNAVCLVSPYQVKTFI